MTEHKNIYAALAAAQSEFGKVTKGATNPAFKSKYADLADVASVVIPVMNAHGCAVIHYLVENAMRTEFYHAASETSVRCDVPLIVDKQNMQGMKSATTYAKRIGLESLSGIAPEDDDGNAAAKAAPKFVPISDADWAMLTQLIEATGTDTAKLCKAYNANSLKAMSADAGADAIAKLQSRLAKMNAEKGGDNGTAE